MPRKAKSSGVASTEADADKPEKSISETPSFQPEAPAEQEAIQTPTHPERRVRVSDGATDEAEPDFVPRPAVIEEMVVGQRMFATARDLVGLNKVKGFLPLPGGAATDALFQLCITRGDVVLPDGIWRVSVRGDVYAWNPSVSLKGWHVVMRGESLDIERPVHRTRERGLPGGKAAASLPDADFDLPEHVNPDALIALGIPLPPEGYYREVYRNSEEKFLRAATASGDYFLNRIDDGWMRWPVQPGTGPTPARPWPPDMAPPVEAAPEPPEWFQKPDSELSVRLQRLKRSTLGEG